MVKRKTGKEIEERRHWDFNDGRLNCDGKWRNAIEDRIKELEKSVGIPELRRLLKKTRYTWRNDSLND